MFEHNQVRSKKKSRNFSDPENPSPFKSTQRLKKRQRRLGQVVVEYVLLLILAVAIASMSVKGCVKRAEGDEGGTVIVFWDAIVRQIGKDLADEPNPN